MKSFNTLFALVMSFMLILTAAADVTLYALMFRDGGQKPLVEISRAARRIEENAADIGDTSEYEYITAITKYDGSDEKFFFSDGDYKIRLINGDIYRFDYRENSRAPLIFAAVNILLAVFIVFTAAVMLYIRQSIIKPFEKMSGLPYELAKGNLTVPLKESKSRYFGKFVWGTDMLRESIERQKKKELSLQYEKNTLLLSLSHEIKTPLSAIKLYARALSGGLYKDSAKQEEIALSINAKANEIEDYLSKLIAASREEFSVYETNIGEYYLSLILNRINEYYKEKMTLVGTRFTVGEYSDCLIRCDIDRTVEILQNIIENAVKYGDGQSIEIVLSQEEDCILVSVKNSGCTLPQNELMHIFDSFWRGSNAKNTGGSGLGLYICRKLAEQMGGSIYARINDGFMTVTTVFVKV